MNTDARGTSLREYCVENCRADLLQQWNCARNGGLTPDTVTVGSRQKVWWIDRLGHEWQQAVYNRTALGRGCPVCAGREVRAGVNDLASTHPHLAAQWDRDKNGALAPQQVTAGSGRKVWWRCEKGHSYQAVIASRANGSGCPYCTNKKILAGFNDLATLEPAIAAEWHPTLNGALTPEMVTPGSRKKVWWECACGHVWKAAVYPRTGSQKCGCPVCAGRAAPARR